MDRETKPGPVGTPAEPEAKSDRRELVRKLGKFAAYAAPFTVLATANKATAASGAHGTGPRKHG